MNIETDDLTRPEIHALLNEHLQSMYALSPPESVHALDLDQLRQPGITFWTAWDEALLLGCGALMSLEPQRMLSIRAQTRLRVVGMGLPPRTNHGR